MQIIKNVFLVLVLSLVANITPSLAQNKSWEKIPAMPKLLSQREQMGVREEWLKKRFDTILLPMMKEHKVDMWIVVNEEFHSDAVTEHIVPPIPIVGRRDFFIFVDKGDKLERYAVVRYEEERLKNHYTLMVPPRTAEAIKKIVDGRDPKTIALNFKGNRGATSGLTYDAYKFLADALGDKYEKRFVASQPLVTDYLDTRIPEELEHYRTAVLATDVITRRAFSNEVIKPGITTVGDVRWWMMQQLNNIGVTTWFQPDLRVQRRTKANGMAQNTQFMEVASENVVLERGDVIHVDFGLIYMGLSTDWQKMGYILQKGEKDAPAGLKAALKNTNRLQDLIFSIARPGMTGPEVYEKTMAECKKEGIQAMIYSHPVGAQGHGLGASIDFRRGIGGGVDERFRLGSYMSIELNTSTAVPEWDHQMVTIMGEDDAHMTESGYQWFRPRQTEFYLIK